MERTCEQLLAFFDAAAVHSGPSSEASGHRGAQDRLGVEGPGGGGEGGGGRAGPQIRFGPAQIQEYHSNSAGIGEDDTFPAPADDFLTLERYMSSGAGQEGRRAGPMSADEALAWQLQDRLFLQVTIVDVVQSEASFHTACPSRETLSSLPLSLAVPWVMREALLASSAGAAKRRASPTRAGRSVPIGRRGRSSSRGRRSQPQGGK